MSTTPQEARALAERLRDNGSHFVGDEFRMCHDAAIDAAMGKP